ncbi:inner membrane zinc metalloprotease [Spiroplasma sp. NBRC 100390]|uniref:RIP metalloprotease RseP n=1 Tax=unclassified Spiroplasma TaxID=2637901 RepID=UPI0008928A48|nr:MULTISPECIES: RIP metalloprotease RseP [unclassified Spiroplasma]AOX43681.1 inner membrane zinc metalloprotease [Spiroplasma sp. TU-14]APE13151.1 inner membrane zinc metalloprotease [Spiroplasma sp. NBRC 100390]
MSAGMIVLGFVIGIIILLMLVTVHEFAHFVIAKLSGAYVYEFAIGFGPKIFSWGKKETRYSIRIFPFGGYVYIASELVDAPKGREEEEVPKERKMENIAKWKRLIFIVAGALMNFFIAVFIFTTTFAALNAKPSDMTYWGAKYDVGGAAYNALKTSKEPIGQDIVILNYWLGSNQTTLKVAQNYYRDHEKDDEKYNEANKILVSHLGTINNIPNYQTTVYNFINNLKKQYNQSDEHQRANFITLDFVRVNNKKEVTTDSNNRLFQTEPVELKITGSTYTVGIRAPDRQFATTAQAYGYGWRETFTESVTILKSFGLLFTGQWGQLSGPVGIAKTVSSILTEGPALFFMYVAMLSANLFVLNLIPIPPLDGYKFLETLIEGIVGGGKRLKGRFQIWKQRHNPAQQKLLLEEYQVKEQNWQLPHKAKIIINVTGAVLFILLFIGITIKDVFF